MTIALFDFMPSHCPDCGHRLPTEGMYVRADYFNHSACTCPNCGLHYQFVHESDLLELAGKDGDMPRYVA